MSEMQKELEEIRETESNKSFGPLAKQWYIFGFDDCYQAMLKNYVPREKVENLVGALKIYADKNNWGRVGRMNNYVFQIQDSGDIFHDTEDDRLKIAGMRARQALKEFEGKE